MVKKYISEIITPNIISSWQPGEKYLIEAQTGSGKSEFIKTNLYQYAKERGERILLLSNRSILKDQNKSDLGEEKLKTITTVNYQYIENQIYSEDKSLDYFYNNFKYIVMDEIHYIFSDSAFNRRTDLLLETILNPPSQKILILITATPQIIKRFTKFKKENIYTIPSDYNYISKLYFYNKKDAPEKILLGLPEDEKAIYFSDARPAYELANKFSDDAVFVCSTSNKSFYDSSMKKVVTQIIDESTFDKYGRILCTTKLMDNGINIKDPQIKTIIINEIELITLLQELGRKRVLDETDTIKLYIRNQSSNYIKLELKNIDEKIESLSDFENMSKEDFIKKYRKIDYSSVIDHDLKVNLAIKQNLLYMRDEYEKMLEHPDGYKLRIYELLGLQHQGFIKTFNKNKGVEEDRLIIDSADFENEKLELIDLLASYENKELNSIQQEEFKIKFFDCLFSVSSGKRRNYKKRGILSINSILEEDEIPYRIFSMRKRMGKRQKQTFWNISYSD